MATKKIEVFSAGCHACTEAVNMVRRIAGSTRQVEVLDMTRADVAAKAKQLGIHSVPSVVVDGKLATCCAGHGPEEATLHTAIHA